LSSAVKIFKPMLEVGATTAGAKVRRLTLLGFWGFSWGQKLLRKIVRIDDY
jgi:hypothetical protein